MADAKQPLPAVRNSVRPVPAELPIPQVPARLVLSDGTTFSGTSFGSPQTVDGEVVFNTGMVGYPQSLTDPSYRGQILVCTTPMVGNYGVPQRGLTDEHGIPKYFESERIQASALVVADYQPHYSHWNAASSLHDWLLEQNIPAITGVDTRALTKHLRTQGVMLGRLTTAPTDSADPLVDPNRQNLVAQVSIRQPMSLGSGPITICAVDCGMKANILRSFLKRGVKINRVPWDHDFTKEKWDGLFISNGPGDPAMCGPLITHLRAALNFCRPIFGICLGSQILGLSAGAPTYKLKYGHRSQNQPCTDVETNRCHITSQNHGYAVAEDTMPKDWKVWFTNGNDKTVEGIRHRELPFRAVQFHPEACPGPTDTACLFDDFIKEVSACRR
ncbi:MAG: glutamine-hydrolyzing carbamoyl-phosphate synthase small subunit [Elusimicrobia bacterium]|nr:glutamine-hydrolyzing carbamoyl-phosphate synthase small subunit [Elusimicrobiota bacterium]